MTIEAIKEMYKVVSERGGVETTEFLNAVRDFITINIEASQKRGIVPSTPLNDMSRLRHCTNRISEALGDETLFLARFADTIRDIMGLILQKHNISREEYAELLFNDIKAEIIEEFTMKMGFTADNRLPAEEISLLSKQYDIEALINKRSHIQQDSLLSFTQRLALLKIGFETILKNYAWGLEEYAAETQSLNFLETA